MDSRAIVHHFEAERRTLALMEHPNIAAVLDAGTSADGRPYFVMELVRGQPITAYCEERKTKYKFPTEHPSRKKQDANDSWDASK